MYKMVFIIWDFVKNGSKVNLVNFFSVTKVNSIYNFFSEWAVSVKLYFLS